MYVDVSCLECLTYFLVAKLVMCAQSYFYLLLRRLCKCNASANQMKRYPLFRTFDLYFLVSDVSNTSPICVGNMANVSLFWEYDQRSSGCVKYSSVWILGTRIEYGYGSIEVPILHRE